MKTILILVLFCFGAKAQHLSLSGTIPELTGQKLRLAYLDHFKSETRVDSGGRFATDVSLEPGYYQFKGTDITVYLEPGMNLSVTKIDKSVRFAGKGSLENDAVVRVNNLLANYFPLKYQYLTDAVNFVEPKDFLNKLDQFQTEALRIVKNTSSSDYFKLSQAENIRYTADRLKNNYLAHYGIDAVKQLEASSLMIDYIKNARFGHPDSVQLQKSKQLAKECHVKMMSAMDSIKFNVKTNLDMNNELAYRSSADYRFLLHERYIDLDNQLYAKDRSLSSKALSDQVIATNITNRVMIEEMKFQYVLGKFAIKRGADIAYKEYIATANNREYIEDIKIAYLGNKTFEGTLAPDFTFLDAKGTKVSLSSMRGNFVYVDMWATYCASCILQMPALKLLEERYQGQNIKFVSIATDQKKDEPKWKKMIADNKLGGIQLIAYGTESAFHKFLRVSGIPRFVLIDPNGIIVSEDALRPDEEDLKKQLDNLLKKG